MKLVPKKAGQPTLFLNNFMVTDRYAGIIYYASASNTSQVYSLDQELRIISNFMDRNFLKTTLAKAQGILSICILYLTQHKNKKNKSGTLLINRQLL
jgi:hypothetical protein